MLPMLYSLAVCSKGEGGEGDNRTSQLQHSSSAAKGFVYVFVCTVHGHILIMLSMCTVNAK